MSCILLCCSVHCRNRLPSDKGIAPPDRAASPTSTTTGAARFLLFVCRNISRTSTGESGDSWLSSRNLPSLRIGHGYVRRNWMWMRLDQKGDFLESGSGQRVAEAIRRGFQLPCREVHRSCRCPAALAAVFIIVRVIEGIGRLQYGVHRQYGSARCCSSWDCSRSRSSVGCPDEVFGRDSQAARPWHGCRQGPQ